MMMQSYYENSTKVKNYFPQHILELAQVVCLIGAMHKLEKIA